MKFGGKCKLNCLLTRTHVLITKTQIPSKMKISVFVLPTVYVDIGAEDGDNLQLVFNLVGMNFNRMFDIKVTQLECANPSR